MFILCLFISACLAGATVQEGVLDVYIQEIPNRGLQFTVTRQRDAQNDGWFAVGLRTREGAHAMLKSTVVVAGMTDADEPTVKSYNPQAISNFQDSWEVTDVIEDAQHSESDSSRVMTFLWKNKVQADVDYLIWAYNTEGDFDITTSGGHNCQATDDHNACGKGVLEGNALLPLFQDHKDNNPTVTSLNVKVTAMQSEIDDLEADVTALQTPRVRTYGDVSDPQTNIALGARVDATSCSYCSNAKRGWPSVLTDGETQIGRTTVGYFSTQGRDTSPQVTVSLDKPGVVATIRIWFRCVGSLSHARGIEALVSWMGKEESCGINRTLPGHCGSVEFQCRNKLAEKVILRKTKKLIQITEIEVNPGTTFAEFKANGVPLMPSYAPREYTMENFIDRSIDVYYGDVIVMMAPNTGAIYQKTSDPCVTEAVTLDQSGAYRYKAKSGVRETVFTFVENNCAATNIYTIHADQPADDLVTESFSTGGTGEGAQGMTQNERDLLDAATTKNTAQQNTIDKLKELLEVTTKNMMATTMSLFSNNEGSSGIKKVRARKEGTQPFWSDGSVGNNGAVSIHDHPDHHQTAGMGEISAILNGVKFTTQHNDYKIRRPTALNLQTKQNKGLEDIPFPLVPESVSNLGTVAAQVEEMREYFRAFHYQNDSIRDYKPFFKPVLCYLEGAWIIDPDFEHAFASDRHVPLVSSHEEQWNTQQFMKASGKKDPFENVSFLPTKIANMVEDADLGIKRPQFANWQYRVACTDVDGDVPTVRMNIDVDDHILGFHSKSMSDNHRKTADMLKNHRGARFRVDPRMTPEFNKANNKAKRNNEDLKFPEGRFTYSFLDKLMEQVAGKDGPNAVYHDDSLGNTAMKYENANAKLNTAFYSRMYSFGGNDAMGVRSQRRGWADLNMFSAMTENQKVAPVKICGQKANAQGVKEPYCWTQRWTYAIPLELIYLTPLYHWNPCNLQEFSDKDAWKRHNNQIGANGLANNPYEGYSKRGEFVRTPNSLFGKTDFDSLADTGAGRFLKCPNNPDGTPVLDSSGNALGKLKLESSGIRILSPGFVFVNPTTGVSETKRVRMRYPIFPIYDHSTLAFREARAIREMQTKPNLKKIKSLSNQVCNLQKIMSTVLGVSADHALFMPCSADGVASSNNEMVFTRDTYPGLTLTLQGGGSTHQHDVECDFNCFKTLKSGGSVRKESEVWDTHDHEIRMILSHENTLAVQFVSCKGSAPSDGFRKSGCEDGHNEVANFDNEEIFKYNWRE